MARERGDVEEAAEALESFRRALETLPRGYTEGLYACQRWGVILNASEDERRWWLRGEELGGIGRVSFNFYRLAAGLALRPCEMPAQQVIAFVEGYRPDSATRVRHGESGD